MWRAAKSSGSKSYGGIDDSEAAQPAVAASSASSASASPARSAGAAGRELEHEQQQHVQAASTSGQGTEAYNETPKRAIHDRNQDSVISLFSNESIAGSSVGGEEDNHDDEDEERLSDDLSDDSTALASRPAYLDSTSTASAPSQPAEQRSSLSSSLDDMVTPSLHTAGMASLQFGYPQNAHNNDSDTRTYSRPPHISSRPSSSSHRSSAPQSPGAPQMTLASYLSSNLSSPKTRSHSSSSLASFPTDFLSDISRAESVVDTDDGASDLLNSDGGEEIGTSSVSRMPSVSDMSASARLHPQHLTHSSDLVMPTLAPASTASTAGSSPSDSERATSSAPPVTRGRPTRPKQASSTSNSTLTSSSATFPRVLIAGGTSKQQAKLRAALMQSGPASAREASRSTYSTHQDKIESVGSFAAACERAERPFTVLQTILRPELPTTDASLLDNLLPSLLEQVAAVSVCLIVLDVQEGKSLAQHVLEQFQHIHDLSKFTSLVPILVESDSVTSGRDSVSQLTQGNIDWLGKNKDGKLASLKSKARPYHIDDLEGLVLALTGYSFNTRTVKAFQKWNAPAPVFSVRPRGRNTPKLTRASSASARPPSDPTASESSCSSVASEDKKGEERVEPPSLASSMLESVSVPPSSIPSASTSSSEERKHTSSIISSYKRTKPAHHRRSHNHLDPLHLPSLLRLVGLNLAASFTSFACTVKALFSYTSSETSEDECIRALLRQDELARTLQGGQAKNEAIVPPTVRPFYGCCRWRYSPDGEGYHEDKSKCQQCGGIVLAGIVVGVALWFS